MFVFKVLIILTFGFIFWQDFKDRLVFWFLYPMVGVLGFLIQIELLPISILLINTLINLVLVLTLSLILFVYTKIILKKKFVNESIGIGDLLFFVFLCFCFSFSFKRKVNIFQSADGFCIFNFLLKVCT